MQHPTIVDSEKFTGLKLEGKRRVRIEKTFREPTIDVIERGGICHRDVERRQGPIVEANLDNPTVIVHANHWAPGRKLGVARAIGEPDPCSAENVESRLIASPQVFRGIEAIHENRLSAGAIVAQAVQELDARYWVSVGIIGMNR